MEDGFSMIITTCPDKECSKKIAWILVDRRLAACVQILPIESIYVWQGKVCEDSEVALFIKSKPDLFEKVAAAIAESHPYELPEIIQLPITDGLPGYLRWIDECVAG